MEGGARTGTERRDAQRLLARLWALLDPAVDALPAGEVLDHLLARLREHFGASAAALALDSGERFGTHAGDPAWPAAAERIELEVQDGLGAVGVLDLAFAATPPATTSGPRSSSSRPGSGAPSPACATSTRRPWRRGACGRRTAPPAACTGSRPR